MLRLEFRPSYTLAAMLAAAHGIAAVSLVTLEFPGAVQWLLGGVVLMSAARFVLARALLRLPGSIVALEVPADDEVTYRTRGGRLHTAQLTGRHYVAPWFTVVELVVAGRHRHICVMPDQLQADQFRQLRVRLRWPPRPPEPRWVAF
jgi:toxin CptA